MRPVEANGVAKEEAGAIEAALCTAMTLRAAKADHSVACRDADKANLELRAAMVQTGQAPPDLVKTVDLCDGGCPVTAETAAAVRWRVVGQLSRERGYTASFWYVDRARAPLGAAEQVSADTLSALVTAVTPAAERLLSRRAATPAWPPPAATAPAAVPVVAPPGPAIRKGHGGP